MTAADRRRPRRSRSPPTAARAPDAAPVRPAFDPNKGLETTHLTEKAWLQAVKDKLSARLKVEPERCGSRPPSSGRRSCAARRPSRRRKRPSGARASPAPAGTRSSWSTWRGGPHAHFRPITAKGSDEPPKDLRFLSEDKLVYEVVSPPPEAAPDPKPAPRRKPRGRARRPRRRRTPAGARCLGGPAPGGCSWCSRSSRPVGSKARPHPLRGGALRVHRQEGSPGLRRRQARRRLRRRRRRAGLPAQGSNADRQRAGLVARRAAAWRSWRPAPAGRPGWCCWPSSTTPPATRQLEPARLGEAGRGPGVLGGPGQAGGGQDGHATGVRHSFEKESPEGISPATLTLFSPAPLPATRP